LKDVKISQVDALFAGGLYPIEFLLYFRERLDTGKIRNSLKKLSSVFWPIFGEFKEGRIYFKEYDEKECYEEDAVDLEFPIPSTEKERLEVYSRYRLPDTKKLFRLRITQFKNGTMLVPKLSHLGGDGYSYFYFLSSLASISQHALLPSKSALMPILFRPHHRRTILKDFSAEGTEWGIPKQETSFMMEIAEIPRKHVNGSIRAVAESKDFRISTNDILCAMAVKKLASGRKKTGDEFTDLTVPIDVRRKVKEYGRRFFGNGIWLHTMRLKMEEIGGLPTEELAIRIRKSMPSVSKLSYVEYLTKLEDIIFRREREKIRPFDPATGYLVTNISRLPIDRLNFGTGPPDVVFPLTIEKNAAAILAKEENFIIRIAR
jgi:hypothetical protein